MYSMYITACYVLHVLYYRYCEYLRQCTPGTVLNVLYSSTVLLVLYSGSVLQVVYSRYQGQARYFTVHYY